MLECVRGQKSKLSDIADTLVLEIGIRAGFGGGAGVDISCLGLDAENRMSDDRYFVFFNQKSSPENAVVLSNASGGDDATFAVDLSRLPSAVKRLVFAITVDNSSMSEMQSGRVELREGGKVKAVFKFTGSDFTTEKAVMIAELYWKDVWRFAATGQGFQGGLRALLENFGGSVTDVPTAPAPAPVAAPAPVPVAAAPAAPKVSLSKVRLEKSGSKGTVDLRKDGGKQPIHVNLNWDNPNAGKRTGLFGLGGKASAPDLDLGCMYRMGDGNKGVVQSLGNVFGSRDQSPFIYLDKDDRSGASSDGENLYILRPDLIDQVLVFAMIYEGTANFANVNGRLTIKDHQGNVIEIPLNNPDSKNTFCAICLIKRVGEKIEITKEERYYVSHKPADEHYGFGFRWVAGSK